MLIPFMLGIVVSSYLLVGIVFFSRRRQGYSQVRHTISELGEQGARDQRRVAVFLFLPVGVICAVIALMVLPASPPLAALAGSLAVGYLVAVMFPCDAGSPLAGSSRQAIHNLGGAVQYLGGGCALLVIAEDLAFFKPVGMAVLACTFAISVLPAELARGLIQRVAELLLFGSLVAVAAATVVA